MIVKTKASKSDIETMSKYFAGFIKVVVDIERKILAGGSDRHVDNEKELLVDGSSQKNLWGGGLDLETKEVDYNSMINLRPNQDNPSRDILSMEVRKKFDKIVRDLLL